MKINIIVAFDNIMGIGKNNKLPWNIPNDLKYFSKLTRGDGNNAIIMGRKTWDSFPIKPLIKRKNLILSKTLIIDKILNNTIVKSFENIDEVIKFCNDNNYDTVWVIGGEKIYKQFINNYETIIDNIYITYIKKSYDCDTFFPILNSCWKLKTIEKTENVELYEYQIYSK
tara:strand:- start:269 stop:778 length:510 start_codon:yes stop_codon:yes gene_type:complete